MIRAISVRILRQVLLVIVLGVIERRRLADFRRDGPQARGGQLLLEMRAGFLGEMLLLGRSPAQSRDRSPCNTTRSST
jgi:hypothetical protein